MRVLARITIGKVSLMTVRHPLAAALEVVAPGEDLSAQPAARCELPLGFSRQPLGRPLCVRERVLVGDVHDGKLLLAVDRTVGAERVSPVGAFRVRPPLKMIVEWNRLRWR